MARDAPNASVSLGKSMRLVVISYTHGLHNQVPRLPDGDVLVHADDFMSSGLDPMEILSFNQWLGEQNFQNLGILDQTAAGGPHLGCEELRKVIDEKKPRVHLFGHLHGGAGLFENGVTRFVKAAFLNESYKPLPPAGQVRVVDL